MKVYVLWALDTLDGTAYIADIFADRQKAEDEGNRRSSIDRITDDDEDWIDQFEIEEREVKE